jgi:molybdate transport system ATP-binding protein
MVFQDGRLFPHLSVRENLLYGIRRAPRAATKGAPGQIYVNDMVALLGLQDLLKRSPATLSGGERQRVAIGRALLSQPRLLLMDEPLAGLDAARQDDIMPYLQRLRETLRLPILYVTHAMNEVARLADHVVLLKAGRVVGQGSLSDMASRVDLPLAQRDDAGGVLRGFLHSHDDERRLSAIACGGLVFYVPRLDMMPQTLVRLRVPAREVVVALDAPRDISVNNIVPAVVAAVGRDEASHAALVELDVGNGQLLARMTLDAADRLYLQAGMRWRRWLEEDWVDRAGPPKPPVIYKWPLPQPCLNKSRGGLGAWAESASACAGPPRAHLPQPCFRWSFLWQGRISAPPRPPLSGDLAAAKQTARSPPPPRPARETHPDTS